MVVRHWWSVKVTSIHPNVSILQEGLIQIFSSGKITKNDTLFMEDGAPCHTARATQLWLNENGIIKLPWPSQSLENLLGFLDQIIRKKKQKPSNRVELFGLLRET